MTFQKGNTLWQGGIKTKQEKQEKIDAFLLTMAGGGMDHYARIMDKLADGKELDKAEEQYLDRMDGWREYVRPKLARKEITGKDGKDLIPQPILSGITNEDKGASSSIQYLKNV